MLFRNSSKAKGFAADELRRGMAIAAGVANGYNLRHLLDRPPSGQVRSCDGVLTDYDRILLEFGMHILWKR